MLADGWAQIPMRDEFHTLEGSWNLMSQTPVRPGPMVPLVSCGSQPGPQSGVLYGRVLSVPGRQPLPGVKISYTDRWYQPPDVSCP